MAEIPLLIPSLGARVAIGGCCLAAHPKGDDLCAATRLARPRAGPRIRWIAALSVSAVRDGQRLPRSPGRAAIGVAACRQVAELNPRAERKPLTKLDDIATLTGYCYRDLASHPRGHGGSLPVTCYSQHAGFSEEQNSSR